LLHGRGRLRGNETPMYQAGCRRDEDQAAQTRENRSIIERI
jgi:hypothetical protein